MAYVGCFLFIYLFFGVRFVICQLSWVAVAVNLFVSVGSARTSCFTPNGERVVDEWVVTEVGRRDEWFVCLFCFLFCSLSFFRNLLASECDERTG